MGLSYISDSPYSTTLGLTVLVLSVPSYVPLLLFILQENLWSNNVVLQRFFFGIFRIYVMESYFLQF